MVDASTLILGIAVLYLVIVLGVGQYAASRTGISREDYLMANRSFGTVVLLFALFATNMTAVVMIGAPGLSYSLGVGGYGFFVGLNMFLVPLFMMTIGYRIWLVGKEFGHITPGQIVNHRWDAKYLGIVITFIYTVWMIHFILVSVQGGGLAFERLTSGAVPFWLGALLVLGVVGIYVYQGGMRGTGWTNTFQGAVFMSILLVVFVWIGLRLGGFAAATRATAQVNGGVFLNRAGLPPFSAKMWLSTGLVIALGTFAFPHLILRYMTARSFRNLQQVSYIYPIAIILVWAPTIMLGFWGISAIPGLENPDAILPALIGQTLPVWMVGIALAGILAAIMSSIDGQILTLSTFFSEDVVREFFDVTEAREVWATRAFLLVIYVASYLGALYVAENIISTAIFFIAGFAATFVPVVSAFYWRGSTKESVYAGLIVGFLGLWAFQLNLLPASLTFGMQPAIAVIAGQIVVMVLTALLTSEPSESRLIEYEGTFEGVW